MAKIVKCPRCSSQMDATNLAPGSSARCAECGAMIRISTGNTSVRTKAVSPPAPAAPAARPAAKAPESAPQARSSKGTEVRRGGTRVARKKSNTGLIIGIVGGAAVLVIVLAVAMSGKSDLRKEMAKKGDAAAPAKGSAHSSTPSTGPAPSPRTPEPAGPVARPETSRGPEDPSKVKWDDWMKQLRSGGGFDDPSRAEGLYFQRVKAMGKPAYPFLVNYIDHEEIMLGRAAASVLNALTQRNEPLPTAATKAKSKADWDAWVKANP